MLIYYHFWYMNYIHIIYIALYTNCYLIIDDRNIISENKFHCKMPSQNEIMDSEVEREMELLEGIRFFSRDDYKNIVPN